MLPHYLLARLSGERVEFHRVARVTYSASHLTGRLTQQVRPAAGGRERAEEIAVEAEMVRVLECDRPRPSCSPTSLQLGVEKPLASAIDVAPRPDAFPRWRGRRFCRVALGARPPGTRVGWPGVPSPSGSRPQPECRRPVRRERARRRSPRWPARAAGLPRIPPPLRATVVVVSFFRPPPGR